MTEAERQNGCEITNMADMKGTFTPETLVRKYASAVLGLCVAHTQNVNDAEDIMQDVFLKAFTKLNTLRDCTRARSWLLKITRRMCVDYYRGRKHSSAEAMLNDVPAPAKGRDERIARLYTAISKLPEGYREPITLYYLDGQNCASVARALGISEEAVRSRLVRARLRLHSLLEEDKS